MVAITQVFTVLVACKPCLEEFSAVLQVNGVGWLHMAAVCSSPITIWPPNPNSLSPILIHLTEMLNSSLSNFQRSAHNSAVALLQVSECGLLGGDTRVSGGRGRLMVLGGIRGLMERGHTRYSLNA